MDHHLHDQNSSSSIAAASSSSSYLDAQRAAVESVQLGRDTLQQAQQQTEQLSRASDLADDTQYSLDHAARLLKNMTWSGWIANKFTKQPSSSTPPARTKDDTEEDDDDDASERRRDRGTTAIVSSSLLHVGDLADHAHDDIPKACRAAFQAIQNYRANLQVLQDCEQLEQLETCRDICNVMHDAAKSQLASLLATTTTTTTTTAAAFDSEREQALRLELQHDLDKLRQGQARILQQQTQRLSKISTAPAVESAAADQDERLYSAGNSDASSRQQVKPSTAVASVSSPASAITGTTITTPLPLQLQQQRQDDHLEFLSDNLNELGYLAQHLNEAVNSSVNTMDRLDDQSESILEQTKHVTRRADRLARQKKGWINRTVTSSMNMQLLGRFAIQHLDSGRYLRMSKGTVFLVPNFDKPTCLVGIYSTQRKQSTAKTTGYGLVGIKNLSECSWLGQSLFGALDATATSLGHRQEWELDAGVSLEPKTTNTSVSTKANEKGVDDTMTLPTRITRLLCASAGWGAGGYLMVGPAPHYAISIGGSGVDDKKQAATWCLVEQPL